MLSSRGNRDSASTHRPTPGATQTRQATRTRPGSNLLLALVVRAIVMRSTTSPTTARRCSRSSPGHRWRRMPPSGIGNDRSCLLFLGKSDDTAIF